MTAGIPMLADAAARLTALTAHDRSLLVEAGAGSGKTAVVAGRLALLLASGIAPRCIAAVTFTELAASELLARVRDFVDELLEGRVPPELLLALPGGITESHRANLLQAAEAFDAITCSTIHGFCQRLIKPYPVEADIDPGASLIDPAEAELIFAEKIETWLRDSLNQDEASLIAELVFQNPTRTHELVTALAEALRTSRMLVAPVCPPVPACVTAFQQAVVRYRTFVTDTLAQEAESIAAAAAFTRMAEVVAPAAHDATPATLVRVLMAVPDPSLCTAKGGFSAYNKKGKWETAAKLAGLSKPDGARFSDQAKALHLDCCQGWHDLLSVLSARVLGDLLVAMRPIVDDFRAYKRSAALLDFDDLIFAARDLLRDHPAVRAALARRYTHVLVDEFQDTDPLQSEIFWRLCGDPVAGGDPQDWITCRLRPGALFLVGDPKQAIYRFRGADVAAYMRAREVIRAENPADVLSVATNFRSCAGILNFVNQRFAPHMTEEKGQPGFTALDPFHADLGDGLCVAALPVACADQDGKAKSEVQRDCEAEAVAEMCSRLIGSQIIVDRRKNERRACRPGDIALLAPMGTDLWRYEEALERRNVPVATQAGKGFYRRQEVQDLIAITRVLADSRDTLALLALLRGPLVGLTEEQLLDLVESQPPSPERPDASPRLTLQRDLETIAHLPARDVFEKLQSLRRRIHATTPHQILAEAFDMLRVRSVIQQRHHGQAERPLANVDLFLSLARPYAVRGLRAFGEAMIAAWEGKTRSAEGRPDAQEEAVSLVTMHASKGLEWAIVVPINTMTKGMDVRDPILDADSRQIFMPVLGVPPAGYADAKAIETAERERERLRLWYVAATRARELLILPKLDVRPSTGCWNGIIDLELDTLPVIDLGHHPEGFAITDSDPVNEQSRDVFVREAAALVQATTYLKWAAPSRDEALTVSIAVATQPQIIMGTEDDLGVDNFPTAVRGGRERGLVIHKLLEEVLSGETEGTPPVLVARARVLIEALGATAHADPAQGLSADELGGVVFKTLTLPEIADVRARLIPEFSVYGAAMDAGVEQVTVGIVDALGLDDEGKPDLIIDWKSDVSPSSDMQAYYRAQVSSYLAVTGIRRGMIVFVTSGEIIHV